MRILVLSPVVPDAPTDGDKLRLYHVLKELGKRHRLTLLAFGDSRADLSELARFVDETQVLPMPRARQWMNIFSRAFFSAPANINAYASDAMRAKVDALLATGKFDAVFCYRLRMVPYALRAKLPRVLDCTDSLTLYWERMAAGASGLKKAAFQKEAEKIAAYEAWAAGQFDAVFMNSRQDANALRGMAPFAKVEVASNGADFERLKPFTGTKGARRDPDRILFIGNLAYAPNASGVLWFYHEVFPRILRQRPKAKFVVVGGHAPQSLRPLENDPRVEMTGFAQDRNPLLNAAGLSVCPVHLAAGRQNKILDAFATATPVVATSLTAQGVEATPGRQLLVADSAEAFAKESLRVLSSPVLARRLGRAGYKFVQQRYHWASSARIIERAMRVS
jgi:sugar transferase (PEP-CTERM/EpsH1 system associated)